MCTFFMLFVGEVGAQGHSSLSPTDGLGGEEEGREGQGWEGREEIDKGKGRLVGCHGHSLMGCIMRIYPERVHHLCVRCGGCLCVYLAPR